MIVWCKIMKIEGKKIWLKDLELEDALKIKEWGVIDNALFCDYNLSQLTIDELKTWFIFKKRSMKKRYFAIYTKDDNSMIGYVGLKNINRLLSKGVLGIVLDPNYINGGYGTESIDLLLNYYFNEKNMSKVTLEVNAFNKRALHVYEKLGFKFEAEYLEDFENQNIDFKDSFYKDYEDYFVIYNGLIYSKIYLMKLDSWSFKQRGEIE